jgi:CopG family transcriptional regulator, nickel-responsive regulator
MNEEEKQIRFSMTIPPAILDEFDRVLQEIGYKSRSKAVRDAVLNFIAQQKTLRGTGNRAGSITIVYDYRNPSNELAILRHKYSDIVVASLNISLGRHHTLEIIAVNGDLVRIGEFAKALQTQKTIKHIDTVILAPSKID